MTGQVPGQANGAARPAAGTTNNPAGTQPWASSPEKTERITARVRAKLRQLPDWDPLPPGEIYVRRPGHL